MAQIAGVYRVTKLVNVLGPSEPAILNVDVDGEDYIFTWSYGDPCRIRTKFTLEKPYNDYIDGRKVTTIVSKDDNKLIFTSATLRGEEKRIYKFDEAGVIMVLAVETTENIEVHYKRIC